MLRIKLKPCTFCKSLHDLVSAYPLTLAILLVLALLYHTGLLSVPSRVYQAFWTLCRVSALESYSYLECSSLSFFLGWHFIQLKSHFLGEVSWSKLSWFLSPVIFYHIALFYFLSVTYHYLKYISSLVYYLPPLWAWKLHDSLDLNSWSLLCT